MDFDFVNFWKFSTSIDNFVFVLKTSPATQRAVCQNGGLISSEILCKFAAVWLVQTAVEAATSASCCLVVRNGRRYVIKVFFAATFDNMQKKILFYKI